jgi:stage V sporulation protein G
VKITSVNVRKIEKENSRMKGIVSILIDDCFAIHDIKIIEGDNGPFVAMPSRRNAVGDYRDIVHPINQETRDMFNEIIIAEYEKAEDVKSEEVEEEE